MIKSISTREKNLNCSLKMLIFDNRGIDTNNSLIITPTKLIVKYNEPLKDIMIFSAQIIEI